MKAITINSIFILWLLTFSLSAFSQCNIQHRLYPDGSMLFYVEPVNFYWTKSKDLKGGIETDKENFYLELQPFPFPVKPGGKKLKDDLELKLANDSVYRLKHFDTRYLEDDTVMQLVYLIEHDHLDDFLKFDVISAKINMQGTEGIRSYVFKLHKDAIRIQLSCLINEHKKKR